MTDLLADVLTRIRNAQRAGHEYVVVPCSKLVKSVLKVLQDEGYIGDWKEFEESKGISFVKVDLKYHQGRPVIHVIEKVSKPGRRVYKKISELKKFYGGLGVSIVSTPKGVMSDDEARKHHLGGEVLCNVY
jgi:small subunit ribosomal protein S8